MAADRRELDALQSTARDVLTEFASSAAVHELIDSDRLRDHELDAQLTALGFYAILFPGEEGTLDHLCRIITEAGAATATTRLLGHAVGVGSAITSLPDSPARDHILARVARGDFGSVIGLDDTLNHAPKNGSWQVSGTADLVPDVDEAAFALVWSRGTDGPRLWALDADRLTVEPRATIDPTRVLSRVTIPAVVAGEAELLASGTAVDQLRPVVRTALDVALAFDSLGIAQRARDLTVDYVRTREQFGRPIGSFQAVQHQAADMAVRTELAQSICEAAVHAYVEGESDAATTAAMAREVACGGASWVAGRAIQLHGGIGYTWEHDAHLLLKRAKLNEVLMTSARNRRVIVLEALRGVGVTR